MEKSDKGTFSARTVGAHTVGAPTAPPTATGGGGAGGGGACSPKLGLSALEEALLAYEGARLNAGTELYNALLSAALAGDSERSKELLAILKGLSDPLSTLEHLKYL